MSSAFRARKLARHGSSSRSLLLTYSRVLKHLATLHSKLTSKPLDGKTSHTRKSQPCLTTPAWHAEGKECCSTSTRVVTAAVASVCASAWPQSVGVLISLPLTSALSSLPSHTLHLCTTPLRLHSTHFTLTYTHSDNRRCHTTHCSALPRLDRALRRRRQHRVSSTSIGDGGITRATASKRRHRRSTTFHPAAAVAARRSAQRRQRRTFCPPRCRRPRQRR